MNFAIHKALYDYDGDEMNAVQHSVALGLSWCCQSDDGTGIYPGYKLLCRMTKLSETAIRRALHHLVEKGFLEPEPRKYHVSSYRFNLQKLNTNLELNKPMRRRPSAPPPERVVDAYSQPTRPAPITEELAPPPQEPPTMELQTVGPAGGTEAFNRWGDKGPLISRIGAIRRLTKEELLEKYQGNLQMYIITRLNEPGLTPLMAEREWKERYE